ncbi:acyl-CoA thioester hydrolase [Gelidibacter algens]|uniref:Acyl-CoA thioester hydrolase n=1 Tax=Gelidibacter algens TaxID=49280 RepID=A0A1A7R333_9FLAO|nr:thioesterase family protein [Gelidibacter algens]OBX26246.1 thioesterase [Gelidibacter algens]RAJ24873.1 acyl-CoA thioester hydrolase [Gelidibacter algens]
MSIPLYSDEIELRVRYGETDQMGVVYHANYAQYFEVGRVEWLRKFGVSYKQMEADGLMLPVIKLAIEFKKPALYDDLIKVKTQLVKLPSARIEFDYEITNKSGEILTLGSTVLVFMDVKQNRPTRCPKYLLDKLQN